MKQEESWEMRAQQVLWRVKQRQAVKTVEVVPFLRVPAAGPSSAGNNWQQKQVGREALWAKILENW